MKSGKMKPGQIIAEDLFEQNPTLEISGFKNHRLRYSADVVWQGTPLSLDVFLEGQTLYETYEKFESLQNLMSQSYEAYIDGASLRILVFD
jgi:hypothetical protein